MEMNKMELNLKLCVHPDENGSQIPVVQVIQNGYTWAFLTLEKAADLLLIVESAHSNPDQIESDKQAVALKLDYLERSYKHEVLGEPGDHKIEQIVLKYFGLDEGMSELSSIIYGVSEMMD